MPGTHDDEAGGRVLVEYPQAILDALRIAKIGVCVTVAVEGVSRNVLVSDAAVEILGHSREVLLSRSAFDFIVPAERERLRELRDRRLGGDGVDSTIETVVVRADGREVPITYVVTDVTLGERPARVSLLWDISARRTAEDALRAEESRLRRLFESAPDGIVVSREGVVLEANPAAARMLGFAAAQELIGTSLRALLSPVETKVMGERIAAAREGARLAPRAYEARRADGLRMTAEITSVPYEHEGKPAVMAFARDVTERLRLQAQLTQSERLAALGTLAAGVAHEINNPLTVMALGLQAVDLRLRRSIDRLVPDEHREISSLLSELRSSVDRIGGIVGELRAFARADGDAPGPTDVVAVLTAAERMAAHRIRHSAAVIPRYDAVPPVVGHARRLEQVFVNLLLNAAQSMREGGSDNRIDVRAYVAVDGRVAVEVKDNGPGMPPEVLSRAFDPFFTTKPVGDGTGLGLSISHGIVTGLGGEISIESEVGRGTTVRVHLVPAGAVAKEIPAGQPADAPRSASRARILIVDDEKALVSSLRLLLAGEHDVTTATTGEAACRALLEDAPFDAVLCDVMMPGVSGMDVYARVRAARPELLPRFVFMTGGAFTPQADEFLASVSNRVLQKPFAMAELRQAILDVNAGTA